MTDDIYDLHPLSSIDIDIVITPKRAPMTTSATLPDYVRQASNELGTPYVRFIGVGRDAPRWQVGRPVNGEIEWIDVSPPDSEVTPRP